MKTITKKEINKYKNLAKKAIGNKKRFDKELHDSLKKLGFTLEILGTGKTAYTSSLVIDTMNIVSRKYLQGEYLVVGMSGIGNRHGTWYRGYVMKIA